MLRRGLAKIVMRAAGEHAKTACGNLQLCAGLEDSIEGETNAVGQRRLERTRVRRQEGEEPGDSDEEEESGGLAAGMGNLRIETVGTAEAEAEELEHVL